MRRRLPAALRERDYARLIAAIVAMGFGREMVLVAVGWQVYAIDRNPLHLGLVGLAEFLPLPLLALPAAQRPLHDLVGDALLVERALHAPARVALELHPHVRAPVELDRHRPTILLCGPSS